MFSQTHLVSPFRPNCHGAGRTTPDHELLRYASFMPCLYRADCGVFLSVPDFFRLYGTELLCAQALTGCAHQNTVVAGRKHKNEPEFQWINRVLGHLETGFSGSYHGFGFHKYAEQYLGAFAYRFNRRFDLRTLPQRVLVAALQYGPQRSSRLVAEVHCKSGLNLFTI